MLRSKIAGMVAWRASSRESLLLASKGQEALRWLDIGLDMTTVMLTKAIQYPSWKLSSLQVHRSFSFNRSTPWLLDRSWFLWLPVISVLLDVPIWPRPDPNLIQRLLVWHLVLVEAPLLLIVTVASLEVVCAIDLLAVYTRGSSGGLVARR